MYKKETTNKVLLSITIIIGSFFILLFLSSNTAFSQNPKENTAFSVDLNSLNNSEEFMDLDNIIVVYKDGKKERVKVNENQVQNNLSEEEKLALNVEKRNNLAKKTDELKNDSNVKFVQPNYFYKLDSWTRSGEKDTPNDFLTSPTASTGRHWYYERESIREVWHSQDCFNGGAGCGGDENIIVAVIDTGLAYETRTSAYGDNFVANNDMFGANNINLYTNSGETPHNNIDDDLNGYVDDYHGLNAGIAISCDNSGTCTGAQRAEEGNPHDDGGHGTYVTGLISSVVDNGFASVSPAFNVTIMPLKATFPYSGFLGTLEIEASINYAIDNGADVINMSWGGSTPDKIVKDALEDAYNSGIILVAATGNDNDPTVDYPARYHNGQIINFGLGNETINFDVTAVGALTSSNTKASYSNYGADIDVVSYVGNGSGSGDAVYQRTYLCFYQVPNCYSSKDYDGGFANGFGNGTSFAAPQVSALYALLRSMKSDLTVTAAQDYVVDNAVDVNTPGFDNQTGWGVINYLSSVNALADNILPAITMDEPNGVEVADQTFNLTWTDSDFDDNAMINLYWDTDGVGANGTLISECSDISEDSETDICEFYTASIMPQTVYIYGCIEDDNFGPICDYAAGTISITHPDGTLRDSGKVVAGSQTITVDFTTNFTAPPVVIANISTDLNSDMQYINIQSVSSTGFSVNIEENANSYDEAFAVEEISWYAVQTVSSDEKLGLVPLDHNWKYVNFTTAFGAVPELLVSLQTNIGTDPSHIDVRNLTISGFEMRVLEAPGYNGIHAVEDVGWIAYENHPTAQNTGKVSTTDQWTQVNFSSSFSSTPVLVFSPVTSNGGEQFDVDIRNLDNDGFEVRVEEDKAFNGLHTTETISWTSFIHTSVTSSSGTNTLSSDWKIIPFNQPFEEVPILVASINSEVGPNTSDIEIWSVNKYFFVARVEEDKKGGWDGIHTYENISWWANTSSNNLPLLAGSELVDSNWETINFVQTFTSSPKVLASIVSNINKDTIELEIRNISTSSFEVRIAEDTRLSWDGIHGNEKVNWIAFEAPLTGEADISDVDHNWTTINFSSPFGTIPRVHFSKRSKNGNAPVIIDVRNITTSSFQMRVEEEPNFYDILHPIEQVSWYADDSE